MQFLANHVFAKATNEHLDALVFNNVQSLKEVEKRQLATETVRQGVEHALRDPNTAYFVLLNPTAEIVAQ